MEVTWSESDVKKLIDFTKQSFTHSDRENLEKCVMNGIGSQYLSNSDHKHSNNNQSSHFKRNEDDIVGQCLDELWSSYSQMSLLLQDVIEYASTTHKNIVTKGLKSGLSLPYGSEQKLTYLSWKKSLSKHLEKHILQQLRKECVKKSSEGCFFSIGNTEYDNLDGDTITQLMNEGFTHINNFIGQNGVDTSLLRELEFMEYNGLFNKIDKSINSYYNDCHVLWLKPSYLDSSNHKATYFVLEKLGQIPYELTTKCKVLLQVITSYCITLMEPEKSCILDHNDGSENGVKFTCIYIPRRVEGTCININIDGKTQSIDLRNDQLILLRNYVNYEIKKVKEKLFFFISWLTGPN